MIEGLRNVERHFDVARLRKTEAQSLLPAVAARFRRRPGAVAEMKRPLVDLVHPTGNQFVRHLLAALEQKEMLGAYYTAFGLPESPLTQLLPDSIRAECERRTYPLSPEKMHTRPGRELVRLLSQKMRWSFLTRHETGYACVDQVFRDLDRAVARRIARGDISADVGGIYGYEDGCLETFRAARKQGLACFYDLPIAYWETVRKLLDEEAARLPEWEPTLVGTRDSREKLARKTEELALADVVICPSLFVLNSLPPEVRRRQAMPRRRVRFAAASPGRSKSAPGAPR